MKYSFPGSVKPAKRIPVSSRDHRPDQMWYISAVSFITKVSRV